jgi:hypothetical protein
MSIEAFQHFVRSFHEKPLNLQRDFLIQYISRPDLSQYEQREVLIFLITKESGSMGRTQVTQDIQLITDTWVEAWIQLPRLFGQFYFGQNPELRSHFALVA